MPKLRHRQTIELQIFQSVYPRRGVDILTHSRITDRCLRSLLLVILPIFLTRIGW